MSSNLGSAMEKARKHWKLLTLNEELLSCWKMTNIYTKKVSWSTLYIWYVIFDEYEERIYFSHTELKSIALDFNSNHPPLIYSHSHCSYSLCWYIFNFFYSCLDHVMLKETFVRLFWKFFAHKGSQGTRYPSHMSQLMSRALNLTLSS